MSVSLIVNNDQKHISGEIKIQKNNGKVNVIESATSQFITNRIKDYSLNSLEEIKECIESVLAGMCFTSRFIGKDMFTGEVYNENDKDLISIYLNGIQAIYDIPGGIIIYHKDNQYLFDCLVIEFMFQDNIIPFCYTNISEDKIYQVKRSDGSVQNCSIKNNGGLVIHEDKVRISTYFYEDTTLEMLPGYSGDLVKGVNVNDFVKLNNIELSLNLPYFTKEQIDGSSDLQKQLFNYYNSKLDKLTEKINLIIKNT